MSPYRKPKAPEIVPTRMINTPEIDAVYTVTQLRSGKGMHPSETEVMLPTIMDVNEAIYRTVHRARSLDQDPRGIILGGRWHAALLDDELLVDYWQNEVGPVMVDPSMERGVRLVLDGDTGHRTWVAKHVAADRGKMPPEVLAMAKEAATNDASLAVLADWFEATGDLDTASALRGAQKGFQVLAELCPLT